MADRQQMEGLFCITGKSRTQYAPGGSSKKPAKENPADEKLVGVETHRQFPDHHHLGNKRREPENAEGEAKDLFHILLSSEPPPEENPMSSGNGNVFT